MERESVNGGRRKVIKKRSREREKRTISVGN